MSTELAVVERPEIVYLSYEEVELKSRIASVRSTYEADDPGKFAEAFTGLLQFLEA